MDADSSGAWLLPTKGRVKTKLPRFLDAVFATKTATTIILIVDYDDWSTSQGAYMELQDKYSFSDIYEAEKNEGKLTLYIYVTPPDCVSMSDKLREVISRYTGPEVKWIGWLGDDAVPVTPQWDRRIIEKLNGWNFVTTDDAFTAPDRMTGACAWSMDLVRAVGYLPMPGSKHLFSDDMWESIGRATGCWTIDMTTLVKHAHHSLDGSADATSALVDSYWVEDERAWSRWRMREQAGAIERVLALMERCGVPMAKPDMSDVSVMIGTPCGSGRYERVYVSSLINTMTLLRQFGATVEWFEMPYCSDVAMARNKLFGAFYRSSHSHMLWLDDDMGWTPQDAVKLIMHRKDFAAAVGLRKTFPTAACVNVSDAWGKPAPIVVDPATDLVIATHVGMAFAVLSRACVERMASSYGELRFKAPSGQEEYGVFNPMIVNERYLAEDYAFCERWNRIGGQIWIAADVTLDHIGSYAWRGSWLQLLKQQIDAQRESV